MEDLNLISCELIALALSASGHLPQKRKVRGQSLPDQAKRVMAYISRRLRAEAGAAGQLGTPLSPAAYHALLPTVWAFIANPSSPHQSEELIHATLDHSMKVTSKSACKRLTLEFVGRLMLVRHFPGGMVNHKYPLFIRVRRIFI